MVGVPGRSKGCNTCRKRKVKCDAEKPFCARCRNSGRQCEGYEKYPVFMIQTQDGRRKRSRLDDLKPLSLSSGSTPSEVQPESDIDDVPEFTEAWSAKIIDLFWSSIGTQGSESVNDVGQIWMRQAFDLTETSTCLKHAVNALCVTRVAWMRGDETLANHGRHFYGLALKSLQTALGDSQTMIEDTTLGAARILMLYEYFESTSDDPSAWMQHLQGFCLLVKARGPKRHTAEFPRALLEDARDSIMIRALMLRESSFLGTKQWIEQPWEGIEKPIRQLVNDTGFEIAALLEMYDKSIKPSNQVQVDDLYMYLKQAYHLSRRLDNLDLENAQATGLEEELFYIGVESAISSMFAWSLKIGIRLLIGPLCNLLEERYQRDHYTQDIKATSDDIDNLIITMKDEVNHVVCMQVCRKILASLRFCFDSQLGVNGGRRLLFPLSTAHYYLQMTQASELSESSRMFAVIKNGKGIGMASAIGKGVNPDYDRANDVRSTGLLSGPGGSSVWDEEESSSTTVMTQSLNDFINLSSQDIGSLK